MAQYSIGGHGNGEGSSDSNGIYVTLSDTDVLDCCICHEPLSQPIFQCNNGHIACANCCSKINKCGTCSQPIGRYRCYAVEKVLESVKIACDYASFGCKNVVRYSQKNEHQKTCAFEPCLCPHTGCNFRANARVLASHFKKDHPVGEPPFRYGEVFVTSLPFDKNVVVLRSLYDGELFVINNKVEGMGNTVSLCHIGPNRPNSRFSFRLLVKSPLGNDPLILQSEAKNIRDCTSTSSSSSLFVPFQFFQPSGRLLLEIFIDMIGVIHILETISRLQRFR